MELGLKNKVALITGGSKGIGFACASALAAEGCAVRLVARDEASLEKAGHQLRKDHGGDVKVFAADLLDPTQVGRIAAAFPDVDILVNSAGAIPRGRLLEVDPDALRAGLDGKLMGTIAMCRAFYREMQRRRSGVIVNIIGISGARPNPKSIGTTTANAALIAFTQAVGAESVDHNIRVMGISPGLVRTERTASLLTLSKEADKAYSALTASLPFDRMAEPGEIGSMVAFLASTQASYMSGEVISIDGGSRFRM